MDQMKWGHPTHGAPQVVNLICLGPSHRDYLAGCFEADISPALQGADEQWTLNRGGMAFRHDLLFVLDHIQGEAEANPYYGATLWKHDKPIITSDNADGWPIHVSCYPWVEIQHWLARQVKPMHGDWFHNSVAFILVYAAFIGVKEIRVFGADYINHSNGIVEDGHPNVAYWVGALERVGLCVKPVSSSGFLNANQRSWIYGYRNDPRGLETRRTRFKALIAGAGVELYSGERQVASTLEGIRADHRLRYEWVTDKVNGIVVDCGGGIGYGAAILADSPLTQSVILIDKSQDALDYAIAHYSRNNISLYRMDLGSCIDCIDCTVWNQANCAVAFEIIEHLSDPKPLLKRLPAYRLFASVPNEKAMPYDSKTAPYHHRHYTQEQFNQLLNDCGWKVINWHGQMGIDSLVEEYSAACRTIVVEAVRRG